MKILECDFTHSKQRTKNKSGYRFLNYLPLRELTAEDDPFFSPSVIASLLFSRQSSVSSSQYDLIWRNFGTLTKIIWPLQNFLFGLCKVSLSHHERVSLTLYVILLQTNSSTIRRRRLRSDIGGLPGQPTVELACTFVNQKFIFTCTVQLKGSFTLAEFYAAADGCVDGRVIENFLSLH